ncbi:hypothetical protein DPMN_171281 [Dreissena polymorpha]|uniref:Uncharacterized protein n=1 Tax=Dreissena polymorpha TaxID=45954 RepID=A0A9D4IF09_DREPO|nr:hypothetical protein DPMN_171281 [Dreissena polymorpha]
MNRFLSGLWECIGLIHTLGVLSLSSPWTPSTGVPSSSSSRIVVVAFVVVRVVVVVNYILSSSSSISMTPLEIGGRGFTLAVERSIMQLLLLMMMINMIMLLLLMMMMMNMIMLLLIVMMII